MVDNVNLWYLTKNHKVFQMRDGVWLCRPFYETILRHSKTELPMAVTSSYHPTNTQLYTSYISAIHQLNTSYTCWLVVTGTWLLFSISYMGCHPEPIDELHHFSRWLVNHQPVMLITTCYKWNCTRYNPVRGDNPVRGLSRVT